MSKPCNSHQNPPKPGTAVQRNPHQMKRRTLERVHTDDKTATRRAPPTLARSATEPVIPGIKREPSEISLSAISNSNSHRSIPKSYVQREVDLTAASQAAKAKLQRKVAIEQELKGAIATLKKPNPRLAVKELVDSAEERTARTLSKSRSKSNPRSHTLHAHKSYRIKQPGKESVCSRCPSRSYAKGQSTKECLWPSS